MGSAYILWNGSIFRTVEAAAYGDLVIDQAGC